MMGKTLLIRADAGIHIGTGHMMRCLALAQAWQDRGGHVVFAMATEAQALEARIYEEGMELVHLTTSKPGNTKDAQELVELARNKGADWIVVDGYHFNADYQRKIKDAGLRLLFIDDCGHAEHYWADIVLNQNLHAYEGLYANRAPYTQLVLGTRYVLLRREFLKWRNWKREIPEVARKVLVTMGGVDPENVTLKVIRALEKVKVDGLEAVIVVGSSNHHYNELKTAVQNSNISIRLEKDVKNMPELMAWADVAVSAGGTTCWELAFMGVPFVVITLAENQRPVAEGLNNAGCAVDLGWHHNLSVSEIEDRLKSLLLDQKRRMEMAECGQRIVDGKGIIKVLSRLEMPMLRLRRVRQENCRLLWQWANDPAVRAASFSSEPIPWERHVEWFQQKLKDPHCLFFIAIDSKGVPIGQVRFDITNSEAIISVSIAKEFRGKGFGTKLIQIASKQIFVNSHISVIHAYVKQSNKASVRAFIKAGFQNVGITSFHGYKAVHLMLKGEALIDM